MLTQTSKVFHNASEFKKKAKCARSSESLPTGLLCNQYNPECNGKSAIRIRAKFRGYLKQKAITIFPQGVKMALVMLN